MNWSDDELSKIDQADDLKIAPFREDGATYGTPTWIWEVVVDGSLYVRGYHGQKSRWYQAAVQQKAGRIIAAGMTRTVAFENCRRPDQRSHRRRLPRQIRQEPVSRADGQRPSTRGNRPDHAA